MKIHFKRVATAALAVAMSLSLAVPAFAAQGDVVATGDLIVTGEQLAGKKVTAIRMFTARATEGTAVSGESYDFDSYVLEDKWVPFFATDEMKALLEEANGESDLPTEPTEGDKYDEELAAYNAAYSDAAVAYLQWLETQSDDDKTLVPDFAEAAQDWAVSTQNAKSLAGLTKTETATQVGDTTTGSATFSNLTAGYYLVFPEMGGTGNANVSVGINPEGSRGTDAMLINIPTNQPSTTWNIKSTYPTVEKKVDDGNTATPNDEDKDNADNGSAQVGDVVTFTLTSKVPDMSDFNTYVFQFTDKLPEGLSLVGYDSEEVLNPVTSFDTGDVTLKIGNTDVATDKFNVSAVTINEGNVEEYAEQGVTADDIGKTLLTVTIENLKNANLFGDGNALEADDVGKPIVLTYKAMINENAVTTDPVTNEASVQYSNDPNDTTLGTSTPDESTVYTYDIDVHKYASGNNAGYLANAVFALSTNGTLGELTQEQINNNTGLIKEKLIPLADNSTGTDGTSYVVDPDGTNYTFTTNGTGAIKVQGLKVGTYYLYEVTAPASYNKLKNPVKIEITLEDGDYTKPVYKVTINGKTTTGAQNDSTINVENKQGIELPETGGIGTIGLTALGVVVVVAGLFVFPRKKKNKQD